MPWGWAATRDRHKQTNRQCRIRHVTTLHRLQDMMKGKFSSGVRYYLDELVFQPDHIEPLSDVGTRSIRQALQGSQLLVKQAHKLALWNRAVAHEVVGKDTPWQKWYRGECHSNHTSKVLISSRKRSEGPVIGCGCALRLSRFLDEMSIMRW